MKCIHQTPNGRLRFCAGCGHYHLEFGNIFLNLTRQQLDGFVKYVMDVDALHYLKLNKDSCNNRKLMLQIGHCGAYFCVTNEELFELRELLGSQRMRVLPNHIFFANNFIAN